MPKPFRQKLGQSFHRFRILRGKIARLADVFVEVEEFLPPIDVMIDEFPGSLPNGAERSLAAVVVGEVPYQRAILRMIGFTMLKRTMVLSVMPRRSNAAIRSPRDLSMPSIIEASVASNGSGPASR